MQLTDPPELVNFEQLRPFLPMWIFPENGPIEGDDHPAEVLGFYESANDLVADMREDQRRHHLATILVYDIYTEGRSQKLMC